MLTKEIVSQLGFVCVPPRESKDYAEYTLWIDNICIVVNIFDNETSTCCLEINGYYKQLKDINTHGDLFRLIKYLQ